MTGRWRDKNGTVSLAKRLVPVSQLRGVVSPIAFDSARQHETWQSHETSAPLQLVSTSDSPSANR